MSGATRVIAFDPGLEAGAFAALEDQDRPGAAPPWASPLGARPADGGGREYDLEGLASFLPDEIAAAAERGRTCAFVVEAPFRRVISRGKNKTRGGARGIAIAWDFVGTIRGLALAWGVRFLLVEPRVWQADILPVEARGDKDAHRRAAAPLAPHVDLHRSCDDGKADALLIALWGLREIERRERGEEARREAVEPAAVDVFRVTPRGRVHAANAAALRIADTVVAHCGAVGQRSWAYAENWQSVTCRLCLKHAPALEDEAEDVAEPRESLGAELARGPVGGEPVVFGPPPPYWSPWWSRSASRRTAPTNTSTSRRSW